MIKILDQKYKSIGNILLIPASEDTPFYVKAPIDFSVTIEEKQYSLVLRYTDYESTFDHNSCKMVVSLLDHKDCLHIVYFKNWLIPILDFHGSGVGYNLAYKIEYNKNDKADSLYVAFISDPLPTKILCP